MATDARFWRPGTIYRTNQLVYVYVEFFGWYTETLVEIAAYNSSGQRISPNPFTDSDAIIYCAGSGSFNGYTWTSNKATVVFAFQTQALANQAASVHCWLWINSMLYDYV